MTTYRLFPATNGPANAVSFGGAFLSGVAFAVKGGGNWLTGYWWWVASNAPVTGVKFALWSLTSSSGGTVVAGSAVTAGTLTASAWNFVPLATPVQLAPGYDLTTSTNGSIYVAAAGFTGNFSDTNSYFNSGDTASAGIVNGPLVAYSGTTGSRPAPYSVGQWLFSTAGSDPGANMPNQVDSGGDGGSNFWIDVQVSDTPPAGYNGSYRLWPNKADTNNSLQGDAAVNYTIGTEVHLTSGCTLNKVWYYSQSGAANLATRASVWNIGTGLEAAVIASPSWSGAAGSGWISASFAGGTTLPAGSYIVSVYDSSGTVGSWAPKDASTNYWGQGGSGGVGSAGITWGPLFAPSQPNATSGWTYNGSAPGATPPYSSGVAINAQPPFGQLPGGGVDFPQLYAPVGGGTNQSQNYWVDLEVTPLPPAYPFAAIAQRRQAWPRGLPRRGRVLPPVRAQLNPPYQFSEVAQRRETWARGLPRRGRLTVVVPPQLNPPYPFAEEAQRRQAHPRALLRRGRQVTPVPPQVNPPYPFAEVRQWRQLRGLLPRRGRGFAPVPAQQSAAPNPAIAFQQPKHLRVLFQRRGRVAVPVPAQQSAPVNPALAFQPLRHARLALAPRRGRGTVHVPGQQDPAPRQRQGPRPRVPALRRGRAAQPVPAQVTVAAPAWVTGHRSPARALALIRRRFQQLIPWPQAVKPPFTPGLITAADRPSTVLSGGDAAAGALTGTTQTTGGPG